jgi:2-polyprenyl-3-methyl-5-hydroxy-6-metoxy-1,4-benzoquinol methylase
VKRLLREINQVLNDILPTEKESKLVKDAAKYWSESRSSNEKKELSHWRNTGKWDDVNWIGQGKIHFNMFENLCVMSNVNKDNAKTMIEWGPGGGANAITFSRHFSEFIGIDISQPNLDECSKQLKASGYKYFYPIFIQAEQPKSCIDQISAPVDFFLSTAVFQHFPSKSYGIEVLNIAHKLLKDEGIALIQIRYDNLNRRFLSKKRDYSKHAITFTSYTLDEFWESCLVAGFNPMYISLNPKTNYAYYFLKKAYAPPPVTQVVE